MGHRRIRREQRQAEMEDSRRRNGKRKAKERERRDKRMMKIVRRAQLRNEMPSHPTVLSWISAQLGKPSKCLKLTDLQEIYCRRMSVDPRTLHPVETPADCHLVPELFDVSNRVISLEGPVDNAIGHRCDGELKKYLDIFLGKTLSGWVSMAGGSTSLSAEYDTIKKEFRVHASKKTHQPMYEKRALGAFNGEARLLSFKGADADGHLAGMSAIHSALLVLHYLGYMETYGQWFDTARELIAAIVEDRFSDEHRRWVQLMVSFYFTTEQAGASTPNANELRDLYDESLDSGDDVEKDFPFKSIHESDYVITVTVPYSKNVRARVMFPKVI